MIAVFTKYDQFRLNIRFKLEDQGRNPALSPALLDAEVESVFNEHYLANLRGPPPFESVFNEHYLANLRGPPPFIRLESED